MKPLPQDYDIIIVGAGASSAGLVYGLLTRIIKEHQSNYSNNANHCNVEGEENDGGDATANRNQSSIRIAVLERGGSDVQFGQDSAAAATTNNSSIFRHDDPSTRSLQSWFTAAHYSSQSTSYIIRNEKDSNSQTAATLQPSTVLHTSTPQARLNNRIVDVPTGSGWGGGTNINAGLVVEPKFTNQTIHDDNESANKMGERSDFANWPGRWKDGTLMQNSVNEVLNALNENSALTTSSTECYQSYLNVCSGRNNSVKMEKAVEGENGLQHVVTSSIPSSSSNDTAERVNYFTALVEPLLRKHPELHNHVTFVSGMGVERVLIGWGCIECKDEGKSVEECCACNSPRTPRAWGVECLVTNPTMLSNSKVLSSDSHRVILRCKQEVILCAGAIGSPSILLASGIGHEDDLREAGIVPWYEPNNQSGEGDKQHRHLPVGRNLRDHVLLPRTFLTPRQEEVTVSCNSIHGWWMVTLPMKQRFATIQLQLADGVQMDKMISHFAATALRRSCSSWSFVAFYMLRYLLSILLYSNTWLRRWTRFHTASINVCLMNPKSVGQVTIVSCTQHQVQTTYSPARLSECKVTVDPGYLSNRQDIYALWRGWKASTGVKRGWYGGCIEILPGFAFIVLSKISSVISSLSRSLVLVLGTTDSTKENDNKPTTQIPIWFADYVAEFANPYYHWCGSCAMGDEATLEDHNHPSSNDSVVDEYFRIRGMSGIRVVDASVFPECISVPTALTCAALGFAAS